MSMIARAVAKLLSKDLLRSHCLHGVQLGRKRFIFATALPPADSATEYDVVVVGGGHAGCEAAGASARVGSKTLMVTHKLSTIGEMSCNPSFGGIGKGHLMREIDALDGICARICDMSGIQFRVLNRSKGPAVWGLRAQIDRDKYKSNMQHEIFNTKGLTVLEESVEDLVIDSTNHFPHQKVTGVCLRSGRIIRCKTVVLTTGTFLRGRITIGLESFPAGRRGDPPSVGLANTLYEAGFTLGRLKTGTPPRIDGRTINYTFLEKQLGDDPPTPFSFINLKNGIQVNQKPCYLTHTNAATHQIIVDNVHLNRHVLEEVTGPRYCPSIESKVFRFKGKCHQVWLEPEGTHSDTVYPNGISCTLPAHLQEELVHTITGLESSKLIFPGYGVEYDCIDARQLKGSLETKKIEGLYLAGQINGSTGYEEAASQGLVAGINAALLCSGKQPFTLSRAGSYIGVLIDDLTSVGVSEPYRMFTSRSEHRILLRPDNADIRLTSQGFGAGCVSWDRMSMTEDIKTKLKNGHSLLSDISYTPQQWMKMFDITLTENGLIQRTAEIQLRICIVGPVWAKAIDIKRSIEIDSSAWSLVRSKKLTISDLAKKSPNLFSFFIDNQFICHRLEIQAHYEELVGRQRSDVQRIIREDKSLIPSGIRFDRMTNISLECREALTRAQPTTIGEAKRIPGVTPAALLHIIHHIKHYTY